MHVFEGRWFWLGAFEDRGFYVNVLVLLLSGGRSWLSVELGGSWDLAI